MNACIKLTHHAVYDSFNPRCEQETEEQRDRRIHRMIATMAGNVAKRHWSSAMVNGFSRGVQAGNLTGEMMRITGFFLCYFQTNPHCVCVCVCVCIHTLQLTSRGVENWCACCLDLKSCCLKLQGIVLY